MKGTGVFWTSFMRSCFRQLTMCAHFLFKTEQGIRRNTCNVISIVQQQWIKKLWKKCRMLTFLKVTLMAVSRWFITDIRMWYQPYDCLINPLFMRRSKKTSKLRVTGLCSGNSPGTSEFPAQMASWVNNGEAGDLRRHRTHYDVTVMDI